MPERAVGNGITWSVWDCRLFHQSANRGNALIVKSYHILLYRAQFLLLHYLWIQYIPNEVQSNWIKYGFMIPYRIMKWWYRIRLRGFCNGGARFPRESEMGVQDSLGSLEWGARFPMIHRSAMFPEGKPYSLGNFTRWCQIPWGAEFPVTPVWLQQIV